MKILFLLILFLSNITLAPHADASEQIPTCSNLLNSQAYQRNNLSAYEMLSPGKNGYIFRTKTDYRSNFSINDKTLKNLITLNKKLKDRGTSLIIFFIPTRGMAASSNIKENDSQNYNLQKPSHLWSEYIDLSEKLNNAEINTVIFSEKSILEQHNFFFKRDHHWQSEAAKIAATLIANEIKKLPSFSKIKKKNFSINKVKKEKYSGSFAKAYKTLCNTDLAAEEIYKYDVKSSEDDMILLGDDDMADIVLIGTSNSVNSASHSYFDGFLKVALQANILNLSKTSGGVGDAMLEFLNSPFYRKKPPAIIIWEIPVYYDLNKQNSFFKKAIALVR